MKRLSVLLLVLFFVSAAQAGVATLGSDADTYLRDATVRGGEDKLNVLGGSFNFVGYLRFDLSALSGATIQDVQLVLRNSGTGSRNDVITTGRFALHGLNNVSGNTQQDWDEGILSTDNVGSEFSSGVVLTQVTNLDAEDGAAVTEGIVQAGGTNYWDPGAYTITISGQDLIDFVQVRVDDGGLTTFIIAQDDGNSRGYGIASKEYATEEWRPVLEVTYVPEPATMVLFGLGSLLAIGRKRG